MECVEAEAGVACVGVVRSFPAVDAPVHEGGREKPDTQGLVARYGADFVVKPPADVLPPMFLN